MKPFLTKVSIFLLITYLCQLLISNVFPAKIPTTAINFNLAKKQGKIDIVYFVDSVNDTVDKSDKDGSAISTFLEHLLVRKRIGLLGQPASQPDVYAAYAAYVSRLKLLPDYLIIAINMRAFGSIWDKESSYQFEEQKLFFNTFAGTLLMPFWPFFSNSGFLNLEPISNQSDLDPISNKVKNISFKALRKIGFISDPKNKSNDDYNTYSEDRIRNLIHANYMYNLTKDHRKVQSLLQIVNTFESKKTKLIFYFTPIDYKLKKAYMGNDFEAHLKKNINLVKSLLIKKHVAVLDLSMSLLTETFTSLSITSPDVNIENFYNNEHLTEQGRRFVAQSLAIEIQKEN